MNDWGYVALAWGGCAVVLASYVTWLVRRSVQLRAIEVRREQRSS